MRTARLAATFASLAVVRAVAGTTTAAIIRAAATAAVAFGITPAGTAARTGIFASTGTAAGTIIGAASAAACALIFAPAGAGCRTASLARSLTCASASGTGRIAACVAKPGAACGAAGFSLGGCREAFAAQFRNLQRCGVQGVSVYISARLRGQAAAGDCIQGPCDLFDMLRLEFDGVLVGRLSILVSAACICCH